MKVNQQPSWRAIQKHWCLLLIIFLFLMLASLYSGVTPPFEGPDEAQHIAYIEWLVREKRFPPQGEAAWETPLEQEAGQTPLYYLIASIPARVVGVDEPTAVYRPNPHFSAPFPRDVFDNDNRAIHDPTVVLPLKGGWLALYLSRAVTILFGVLLVVSTYGLAWQVVFQDRGVAASAAFLVGFTPQILYISGVVSNDIPAAAFSTLTLWLLAVFLRRLHKVSFFLPFTIGAALGLATLSKVNSLVVAAPIGVALLWVWLSREVLLKTAVKIGLFMTTGFLAVTGWWFARTWFLYGSPLGLGTHDLTPWVVDDPEKLAAFGARWLEVVRYYWLALGWGTIRPPAWVYSLFFLCMITAVIGLVLAFMRWLRAGHRVTTTTILYVILAVAILANALFLEIWMRRVIAPYGRLLFPSAAAITLFLILGWRNISRRFQLIPLAFIGLVALLTPFLLLQPAYRPQLLSAAEIEDLPPSTSLFFGTTVEQPIAELISLEPLARSAQGDSALPVKVCWRVLAQADVDYSIFLQVIGPENSLITHRRSYPGQGLLLTTSWQPNSVICDIMHIPVFKELENTLVYDIEVGMIDEPRGERLLIFDQNGKLQSSSFLGKVRLASAENLPNEVADLSNLDGVQLIESAVLFASQQGDETVAIMTQWATAEPLLKDYQMLVHLIDEDGDVLAQADGPPVAGWYPTSWWPVGEIITDQRELLLPDDLAPGKYRLIAGFYDLATLARIKEPVLVGILDIE